MWYTTLFVNTVVFTRCVTVYFTTCGAPLTAPSAKDATLPTFTIFITVIRRDHVLYKAPECSVV